MIVTPENVYERQESIRISLPDTATVIGCGGTGFWTGLLLAMSGVQHIVLIDPDNIEGSNLNRLPVDARYITHSKAQVLKEFIARLRSNTRIEAHVFKVDTEEKCQIIRGAAFCCTDNFKSQQMICAYCKKNGLPYQRIGYDGAVLNVSKAFPLSFNEEVPDGYEVTPSWVVPAVMAAAAGVSSMLYSEICLMDDISKLHIMDCSQLPFGSKTSILEQGRQSILNHITEYMPEEWGDCSHCDRPNCDDCEVAIDTEYEIVQGITDDTFEQIARRPERMRDALNAYVRRHR